MLWPLLQKEFLIELRERSALSSILLYVVSTVFVAYMAFRQVISPQIWNALFWIIVLFSFVNAFQKSFGHESNRRHLYLYSLHAPEHIITSKILYNSILGVVISTITLLIYLLFIGNRIQDISMFYCNLMLGSIGLASTLTLTSAIASRTNNNFSIMAIISFPISLPMLLILIRVSKNAVDGLAWSVNSTFMISQAALILVTIGLSYLLFPYLWKD